MYTMEFETIRELQAKTGGVIISWNADNNFTVYHVEHTNGNGGGVFDNYGDALKYAVSILAY